MRILEVQWAFQFPVFPGKNIKRTTATFKFFLLGRRDNFSCELLLWVIQVHQ